MAFNAQSVMTVISERRLYKASYKDPLSQEEKRGENGDRKLHKNTQRSTEDCTQISCRLTLSCQPLANTCEAARAAQRSRGGNLSLPVDS